MLSKRNISICGSVLSFFFFFGTLTVNSAADTIPQIISNMDNVLKENPLKAGENIQMIKIAQDDTMSLFVVRQAEGFLVKPHFHKTHVESMYVIKDTAKCSSMINGLILNREVFIITLRVKRIL